MLVSQEPVKDPSKNIFEHIKLRFLRTWAFRAVLFAFWSAATQFFSSDFLPETFYNCQNSVQPSFNVVILVTQSYIPYFCSKEIPEEETFNFVFQPSPTLDQ